MFNFLNIEGKKDKDTRHPPPWIFKKTMTSQQGKILFSYRSY